MKRLMAAILASLVTGAWAGDIPLTWDPPTTYVDGTAVTNALLYSVYQDGVRIASNVTSNVYTATLPPAPAHRVSWTVTAYVAGGWESVPCTPFEIKRPKAPTRLRTDTHKPVEGEGLYILSPYTNTMWITDYIVTKALI